MNWINVMVGVSLLLWYLVLLFVRVCLRVLKVWWNILLESMVNGCNILFIILSSFLRLMVLFKIMVFMWWLLICKYLMFWWMKRRIYRDVVEMLLYVLFFFDGMSLDYVVLLIFLLRLILLWLLMNCKVCWVWIRVMLFDGVYSCLIFCLRFCIVLFIVRMIFIIWYFDWMLLMFIISGWWKKWKCEVCIN